MNNVVMMYTKPSMKFKLDPIITKKGWTRLQTATISCENTPAGIDYLESRKQELIQLFNGTKYVKFRTYQVKTNKGLLKTFVYGRNMIT